MGIRSVLAFVLIIVAVLVVIFACASITEGREGTFPSFGTQGPSVEREFRLLSIDIPQSGSLSADVEYWATINFEGDRKPEIRRACFSFSGGAQSCVDVQAKDVNYGAHPHFRVPIHVPVGTRRIDCYAEYIRDGNPHRTNTVTFYVIVLKKPEE